MSDFQDPLSPQEQPADVRDNFPDGEGDANATSKQEMQPQLGLWAWVREGVRSGLGLRPRTGSHQPTPLQVLCVVVLCMAVNVGIARWQIDGPAVLNWRGVLLPWWSVGASLLLGWWLLASVKLQAEGSQNRLHGLASWFVLSSLSTLPFALLGALLYWVAMQRLAGESLWLSWVLYIGFWLLMLVVQTVLALRFGVRRWHVLAYLVVWIALTTVTVRYFGDRPWWPDRSSQADEEGEEVPHLTLSQEAFETQQQVWRDAVAALRPQRAGQVDVYGVLFAPYASEDVFLREARMVSAVLQERFDAQGRVLHLQNHATTLDSLPWATPLNLERALQAVAQRMDRDNDVLVLYLTSHGASDFKLSAEHWPLEVARLEPAQLRAMLDRAGIRNRVIAISACYSGGWIAPLANEHSLVMTAANAERTSYGCGRKSELTYFGRAVFNEQLRETYSFEQAFAAARPIIEAREKEVGKTDYSDPQIRVGAAIQPVLAELERRLAARPAKTLQTAQH